VSDEPWRQVHPASFAVNLIPRAWSLLRSAWPLFLAAIFGGWSREALVNVALLAGFFGVALTSSVVHTLTLRYRVAEGRLEIRSGLLARQARVIGLDRIQNVVVVRNVFHRLSGLCELRVETASGREVEGLLSAIDAHEAERLMAALSHRPAGEAPPADLDEVVVANGPVELIWSGVADLRLGAIAVVVGLATEWLPEGQVPRLFAGPAGPALVVALVSGAWLVGVGGAVVRRYGFRLARTPRGLVAEQGLLTRSRTELRRSKVQIATWLEPLVLRLAGLGSVQIETAAAREAGSGTERAEAVVPVVDPASAALVLRTALGSELDPTALPLTAPHPWARWSAYLATSIRLGVLMLLVSGVAGSWALALGLVWPVLLVFAELDTRSQGYAVVGRLLVARAGFLTRRTAVLDLRKVQSTSLIEGPLMRWWGVAVLVVRVAGSRVVLPVLAAADAREVQDYALAGRGGA
jgi:putative membrane protein